MNKIISLLSLLFFFGTIPGVQGQTNVEKQLKTYMHAQAAYNHFSGSVLIAKKGTILFEKSYGYADREWAIPNTADTRYNLSSVSKMFTAVCILQLVDKGSLAVKDTLSKFFPGFPLGNKISLHMMLNHTSGLSNDFDTMYMHYTTLSAINSDSVLAYIKKQEILFDPGSQSAYSNTAYYLLALIIEKVSGKSYKEYLNDNVFKKAGMSSSGVVNNNEIIFKKARNYFRNEINELQPAPYINWDYNIGHDGIYSTVEDLYRFDQALYGNQLLSATSKKLMISPNQYKRGYGCGVFQWHGRDMMAHAGRFWGAASTLDRYFRDSVTIIILANNAFELISMGFGLSAIVFNIPVETPYHRKEIKVSESQLDKFIGGYGNKKFVVIKENGRLLLKATEEELVPETATRFFIRDNPNLAFDFNLDRDGRVISVKYVKGGVAETFNIDDNKSIR